MSPPLLASFAEFGEQFAAKVTGWCHTAELEWSVPEATGVPHAGSPARIK